MFSLTIRLITNASIERAVRSLQTICPSFLRKIVFIVEIRQQDWAYNPRLQMMRASIPKGTIRATVLIETITAAFEMDEILYELRDHSAGLNCGRWDYIFSFIKKFRNHKSNVLPDRGEITMQQPFLRSYVELMIHTCHRRGIHALGGMAAQIPIRNNPEANEKAMERVKQDKLREVRAGHDGTWVAHPGLVPVAKTIFDEYMPAANQIAPPANPRSPITAANLLEIPKGTITEAGLRRNIDVGLQYLEAWLRGK